MTRTAFVLSLGFGVLALSAQHAFPADAARCAPRDVTVDRPAECWKETRRSVMLAGNERLFEVIAADHSDTRSLLRTTPGNRSCVVAAGSAHAARERRSGRPI
jgi:hypothetical protein